jgi:hypothetical protein
MNDTAVRPAPRLDRVAIAFFIAIACLYWSWSPQSMSGMGYAAENQNFAVSLVTRAEARLHGGPMPNLAPWPRHGILEALIDLPIVVASRTLFGDDPAALDQFLAVVPVVETAALCTLVLVWARRLTRRPRLSLVLGCVAAFATMLWPYAYIGLETTQSLAVMVAGYLILREDAPLSWPAAIGFAVAAGFAVSVKSNGLYLAPAIAWLVLVGYRGMRMGRSAGGGNAVALTAIAIIAALYVVNAHTRAFSATYAVGTATLFHAFATDGVISYLFNAWNLIASANKGLIVFAPITLLGLVYLRQTIRTQPTLGIFVALVVIGLVGGTAIVFFYADETWGPRYLHATIAPLIVIVAAAHASTVRPRWPIAVLAAAGLAVSALGATCYYGITEAVQTEARQNTLSNVQTNVTWNAIHVDFEVLRTWWTGTDRTWPLPDRRWFPAAGESLVIEPPVSVHLAPFAVPQPVLLRKDLAGHVRRHICLLFLVAGLLSLVLQFAGAARERRPR